MKLDPMDYDPLATLVSLPQWHPAQIASPELSRLWLHKLERTYIPQLVLLASLNHNANVSTGKSFTPALEIEEGSDAFKQVCFAMEDLRIDLMMRLSEAIATDSEIEWVTSEEKM